MHFRPPSIFVFLPVLLFISAWSPARGGDGNLFFSVLNGRTERPDSPWIQVPFLTVMPPSRLTLPTRGGGGTADLPPEPSRSIGKKRFVQKVIDGDTVEMENGERVRYIGVDTPELRRFENGEWVRHPEPFGLSAYRFNQKLVEHRSVYLELDQVKRDAHHRTLAYLFVDGRMVNGLLIREGLGRVVLYPPNTKYAEALLVLQREAWKQRKGLWNVSPED